MNTSTEETKEITIEQVLERLTKFCDTLDLIDEKLVKMLSDLDEVSQSFDKSLKVLEKNNVDCS